MNQSNNTFHYAAGHNVCFNGYFPGKKAFSKQPDSLFSMALFETMVRQHETLAAAAAAAIRCSITIPRPEFTRQTLPRPPQRRKLTMSR